MTEEPEDPARPADPDEGREGVDPLESLADEVFAGWLLAEEEGRAQAFEGLLAQHPQLGERLERRREEMEAARAVSRPSPEAILKEFARHSPREWPYVEGELLGRGSFGEVRAVDERGLERRLAMKRLLAPVGAVGEDELGRFLEEAQVLGQLDHPGIVPLASVGTDPNGRPYFTMRLVRGRDFTRVIEDARVGVDGWSQSRALESLLRVIEAVAFAHSKGVVHRDLKPANLRVGRFGETYVLDWGLARVAGRKDRRDLRPRVLEEGAPEAEPASVVRTGTPGEADSPLRTMDGTIIGTPAYMSPEQVGGQGELVDERSDVYGLGAILFHLLTGRSPFVRADGEGHAAVLTRVLRGERPSVLSLEPTCPAELGAIADKALATEREARYVSAEAMASDLRAYLEGRVVGAYEAGALAEARKWVQRNRGLSLSLAAAAVALIFGGVFYLQSRGAALAKELAEARAGREQLDRELAEQRANQAARERELAQRRTYAGRVSSAMDLFLAEAIAEARTRLDEAEERLRGWEWHVLEQLSDDSILTVQAHSQYVTAMRFVENEILYTAAPGEPLRLWDPSSLEPLGSTKYRPASLYPTAIAPDAAALLGVTDMGKLRVIEPLNRARPAPALRVPGGLDYSGSASFCGEGDHFLIQSPRGRIEIYRTETQDSVAEFDLGQHLRKNRMDGLSTHFVPGKEDFFVVANTVDIRLVGSGRGATVFKGNAADGTLVERLDSLQGDLVAVSPNGKTYAILDPVTGRLALRSLGEGPSHGLASPAALGRMAELGPVVFSSDGEYVVAAMGKRLRVWETATGAIAQVGLSGHRGSIFSLVAEPDGATFLSGDSLGVVKRWRYRPKPNPVRRSSDVTGLLPFKTGYYRNHGAVEVEYSRDGAILYTASGDRFVRTWTAQEHLPIASAETRGLEQLLAVLASGREAMVSLESGGLVRLWQGASLQVVRELDGSGTARLLAFDPASSRLAIGRSDGSLSLLELETRTSTRELPTLGFAGEVVWEGLELVGETAIGLVSLNRRRHFLRWNLESGEVEELELSMPFDTRALNALAVTPDGSTLVARLYDSSGEGHRLHAWTLPEGLYVGPLEDSGHLLMSELRMFPDGKRLAAVCGKELRVWDPSSLSLLTHLDLGLSSPSDRIVQLSSGALAVDGEGRRVVVGRANNTVTVFDGTPRSERPQEPAGGDADPRSEVYADPARLLRGPPEPALFERLPGTTEGWNSLFRVPREPEVQAFHAFEHLASRREGSWSELAQGLAQRAADSRPDDAWIQTVLGGTLARWGDAQEAEAILERACTLAEEAGDRRSQGIALAYRASALERLGDLEQARSLYDEAFALNEEHNPPNLYSVLLDVDHLRDRKNQPDPPEGEARLDELEAAADD